MIAVVVTVLIVLVAAPGTFAETVPCSEGSSVCSSAHSTSRISNNVYCCLDGFGMSWTGSIINGVSHSSCVCYRQYHESDCVQGVEACKNATSRSSSDQCCLNGESMHVLANVNSCKCRRYISYATINGVFREMTPEEKAQFDAEMSRLNEEMNNWSQDFNHQMNQFSHNLNNQMNQLSHDLAHMFDRRGRRLSGSFPFYRR